jgi:hypothetical protein
MMGPEQTSLDKYEVRMEAQLANGLESGERRG